MPKITEEHRELKRLQILEAAWRCFQREGLQATRIEHIIKESGLSASALYRYFKNKDDIILNAIHTSLTGLSQLVAVLTEDDSHDTPSALIRQIILLIQQFSTRSDYNLMSIAIQGWGEAQHNDAIRLQLAHFYLNFRIQLETKVKIWQQQGIIDVNANPTDVAQMLLSIVLGEVVQLTIIDGTDAEATARGLAGFL